MTNRKAMRPARVLNPRVTLRAKTIQSKKKVASKAACRKYRYHTES